jgi:hypothetical protein
MWDDALMTTNQPDRDACPNCGAHVESNITYSVGSGEPMREPDTQARDCPECGTSLRRQPGQPWQVDTRP